MYEMSTIPQSRVAWKIFDSNFTLSLMAINETSEGAKNKESVLSIELSGIARWMRYRYAWYCCCFPFECTFINPHGDRWTQARKIPEIAKYMRNVQLFSVSIFSPTSISHASNKWKIRSLENSRGTNLLLVN